MPREIRIESLDVLKAMKEIKERESKMKEVTITWSVDDVKVLRPGLSDEEAGAIFDRASRPLRERSIEEGWGILETLINIIESDIMKEKGRASV